MIKKFLLVLAILNLAYGIVFKDNSHLILSVINTQCILLLKD